jgi:mercuric ion transport protein
MLLERLPQITTFSIETLMQPVTENTSENSQSKTTLIAGILAGMGASACCVGPLLLLSLGISGSWIGYLSDMEAYRPYLTVITLIFMGLAFRKLYLVPQQCAIGTPCASPSYMKKQRIIFWLVSAFIFLMITFPYYAEYIIE